MVEPTGKLKEKPITRNGAGVQDISGAVGRADGQDHRRANGQANVETTESRERELKVELTVESTGLEPSA